MRTVSYCNSFCKPSFVRSVFLPLWLNLHGRCLRPGYPLQVLALANAQSIKGCGLFTAIPNAGEVKLT
jgi:hypothetical protein